jgi:PHD/YefM family antitoxin component YafN of YafNO toxin-antitoxin module
MNVSWIIRVPHISQIVHKIGFAKKVSTADFIKHDSALADRALSEPVTITKNGRDRLVVLSAQEYGRLQRRDRRVISAGELAEDEVALVAEAEVPAEHAYLDEELKDCDL